MGLPPDGLMPDEAAAIRRSIESSPRAPAVLTSNITAKADLQPQVTSTFPARPEFPGALPAAAAAAINSGRGRRSTLAARTAAFSPPVPAPASTTAGPQFGLAHYRSQGLARRAGSRFALVDVPARPEFKGMMPTPGRLSPPVGPVASNPEIAGILSDDAVAAARYLDPARMQQPGRLAYQNPPKDQARIRRQHVHLSIAPGIPRHEANPAAAGAIRYNQKRSSSRLLSRRLRHGPKHLI